MEVGESREEYIVFKNNYKNRSIKKDFRKKWHGDPIAETSDDPQVVNKMAAHTGQNK